ncbi:MAG: ligase-associated DNA damage response endonuclease PdeM [Pseudomonadota bacterium]
MSALTQDTATQADQDLTDTPLTLAGETLVLDPAGALWIPSARMLVIADMHLEKAASFARRGQFLPPYDSVATLRALAALIERRNPRSILCLGDSFHDPRSMDLIPDPIRSRLTALQRGRDWIWVTGNHDPDIPVTLGGECVADHRLGELVFRHIPAGSSRTAEIAGHFHPAAKIRQRGRSVRRPAFVTDGVRLILPAFGYLTGGLNVLDAAIATLFRPGAMRSYALGTRRIYPIAPAMLQPDRFSRLAS